MNNFILDKWTISIHFNLYGDQVIQQLVEILMGSNCGPLLVDLFLFFCEATSI
jgi:hypothetical protein